MKQKENRILNKEMGKHLLPLSLLSRSLSDHALSLRGGSLPNCLHMCLIVRNNFRNHIAIGQSGILPCASAVCCIYLLTILFDG